MRPFSFLAVCLVSAQAAPALADHAGRHRVAPSFQHETVIRTPWTLDIPADTGRQHGQVGVFAGVDGSGFLPNRQRPDPRPLVQVPPVTVPPDILAAIRRQLGLPAIP